LNSEPPFDVTRPPAEPPQGCQYPERWREHHERFEQHQADRAEYCRVCEVAWPWAENQLAVRGLLDAYAGSGPAAEPTAGAQVGGTARCRRCGYGIDLHDEWGWLHVEADAGLILCRYPQPGSPPLCGAEPDTE